MHPFFGRFSERFGTPVRVNVLTASMATAFMVVAVAGFDGGTNAKFVVLLDIAISTTLMSYLWIFPASLRLRYTHPRVPRPYRVPGGRIGIWIATALITFWVALGSWVAAFPGTLETLLGLHYDFAQTWGVTRATFETLTIGTLGVILLIALAGYAAGRPVRGGARVEVVLANPSPADSAAG